MTKNNEVNKQRQLAATVRTLRMRIRGIVVVWSASINKTTFSLSTSLNKMLIHFIPAATSHFTVLFHIVNGHKKYMNIRSIYQNTS